MSMLTDHLESGRSSEQQALAPSLSTSSSSHVRRFPLVNRPESVRTSLSSGAAMPNPQTPSRLAVGVLVRFKAPLNVNYERDYQASPDFEPTDDTYHALLERLDHGCKELITRCDSSALQSGPQSGPDGKPVRFEAVFTISRAGSIPTVRSYISYQQHPLSKHSALDVTEATDRMVGTFLRRHDPNFRWHPRDRISHPENGVARQKGVSELDPLPSVPPCRFLSATQDYEFVPGYQICLSFQSQLASHNSLGISRPWQRQLKIESCQSTPLTLGMGEVLAWKLSCAVYDTLSRRKRSLDDGLPTHQGNEELLGLESTSECATNIELHIKNGLGIDHAHLRQVVHSKLSLFRDAKGLDCNAFLQELENSFSELRHDTDAALLRLPDFHLVIYELSGPGWVIKNPLSVSLDSSICYSRRMIQAVLERVQTGIRDVLRGNDLKITLRATKRGHVVLDKTLVAKSDVPPSGSSEEDEVEQKKFISLLGERIKSDIAMVIRDTFHPGDEPNYTPRNLHVHGKLSLSPCEEEKELHVAVSNLQELGPDVGSDGLDEQFLETYNHLPTHPGQPYHNDLEQIMATEPEHHPEASLTQVEREENNNIRMMPSHERNMSFTMTDTDEEDSEPSIVPSTPSLSDHEIDTPHDSFVTTPSPLRLRPAMPYNLTSKQLEGPDTDADTDVEDAQVVDIPTGEGSSPGLLRWKEPRSFSLLGPRSPCIVEKRDTTVAKLDPYEAPDPISFEGWLEYSCETLPAAESAVLEEGERTLPDSREHSVVMEGYLEYHVEAMEDENREQKEAENNHSTPAGEDIFNPQTPTLTNDDSDDGHSLASQSPTSFIDLHEASRKVKTYPAPPSPFPSLWSQSRPDFVPDDLDLSESATPFEDGQLPPCHQQSPPSPDYPPVTSMPSAPAQPPDERPARPSLSPHKRQYSTPTAGYLGLLHNYGSTFPAKVYSHQNSITQQPEESLKRGTSTPVEKRTQSSERPSGHRRTQSRILLELKYEKGVDFTSRYTSSMPPEVSSRAKPSTSRGDPGDANEVGMFRRSGSYMSFGALLS